ncbi:Zinc finger protein 593-like protein [Phytophthora ramorum]|nr:Zinc finger protein 593-like protein [Phytophthora ramorum]
MGTGRSGAGRARAHAKKKQYKRGHATKNRSRDIDQIQDDLSVEKMTGKNMAFEEDEDLPGLGQFYCTPCGRHFIDAKTRDVHLKTKVHKRRLKDVAQKQYTQNEAMQGAGKAVEAYTPAHPKPSVNMDDL